MLLGIVVLARIGIRQWSPEAPRKRNSCSSLDSVRDTLLRSLWWRRNASGKGKPVKARTAASGPQFFGWQGFVTGTSLFVCGSRCSLPICFPRPGSSPVGINVNSLAPSRVPSATPGTEAVAMENMAEEELPPQEEEEEAQVRVPAPAADSALDSAPAPALAPAPAPAPALSPSLASVPEEAESSKCRRPDLSAAEKRVVPRWGGPSPGWFLMWRGRLREMGGGGRSTEWKGVPP